MKNKAYLFLTTALIMCSCADFLTENPQTMPSESSVYTTEELLESSVRGIMETFYYGSMYTHDMQEFMQTASCLVFFPYSSAGIYDEQERFYSSFHYAQSPTTKLNNEMYFNHYVGISRCNKLIEGLKSSPVDDEYKKHIEAEARFLRAVLYFGLVRFYGDVPLVTRMPRTANDADAPRENYSDVYKFILDELDYAHEYMRDADEAEAADPGGSRPNRWAARAFMAAVYTQIGSYLSAPSDHAFGTQKTGHKKVDFSICGIDDASSAWTLAYEAATDVIDSKVYELAPSYSSLFRWKEPGDWQLKERIFILPVSTEAGSSLLARRSLPPYPEGTRNTLKKNSNYGRFRPTRFVFQKWCETYGGQHGTGENNSGMYVSCPDPRFDATFIHTSTVDENSGKEYSLYPDDKWILSNNRQKYAPYFRKYLDPSYDANVGHADFYFMRFAEMYLIAAEAAAELCENPSDAGYGQKAFEYIEELHKRARGEFSGGAVSNQPRWESGKFATKKELINAIMWERVFEMYGEGHEWFDTHRRGTTWFIENIIAPANDFLQRDTEVKARTWYGEDTFLFNETPSEVRKGLFNAFPENELTYNTVLDYSDQNIYIWK